MLLVLGAVIAATADAAFVVVAAVVVVVAASAAAASAAAAAAVKHSVALFNLTCLGHVTQHLWMAFYRIAMTRRDRVADQFTT